MILQTIIVLLLVAALGQGFIILKRTRRMQTALDDLKAAMAAEDTAIGAVIIYLQGIPGLIAAAQGADNPDAALEQLANEAQAHADALTAALKAAPQPPAEPPPVLAIDTTALSNGQVGSPYTGSIAVSGGAAPYSIAITGLPDGLTDNGGGSFAGTPTAEGTSSVSVSVVDSSTPSPLSASATLTLVVDPAAA